MSGLAAFLEAQGEAVAELLARRLQASGVAMSAGHRALVAEVPGLLRAVRGELAAGEGSGAGAVGRAQERGGGRVGLDVHGVVGAYAALRDCVFELLEAAQERPEPGELRVLSAWISAATREAMLRHAGGRDEGADAERMQLLELFQQAPGFVAFMRGPELVFELVNAAYLQLVGHREIVGKPVREALPEVEGQGYFELLDQVMAKMEPFIGQGMPVHLQREPGAPLAEAYVDFIYQPIVDGDGEVMGVLAQGHEVTEVKRQEAQRERAEERYRMLFESIDDGFCLIEMIFDARGEPVDYRFIETNAAFEGHTGLVGAVGRTSNELVPGLDRSWAQMYGRVATTGESTRFENHDAAMGRWFDVYASRVGGPQLRQVALVFKDVSERKRVEQERARLFELERAARREAEEASRLRDEFLATVSHELRTPLTAILGWVQMLRVGGLAPDRRDRALETVERNARAQAQLIEDLLDVSSILAGKLRLAVSSVDLHLVVEAALETVRPAADAKGVRLQATLASDCTVMGDAQRLQQVVWNLLSNAVKFTPRDGRVQVLVARQESSVEVVVADTGRGIEAEFQPYVFERFRQQDGATTRSHGGLGLGLSIVRQLVEMHGGLVSVFSEGEGEGTSFTVQLPLAATRRSVPSTAPARPLTPRAPGMVRPPELGGLQVLVVDDEADTREMLRTLLEQCGVRVRVAASAAEALQLFRQERPDLLLSDIGMPSEDGYWLIEQVRGLSVDAGGAVAAVALTAFARTEDRTRALMAGFNNHVSKPVEPVELLAVIASLSGRTRRG